jgi:hypothetical protein
MSKNHGGPYGYKKLPAMENNHNRFQEKSQRRKQMKTLEKNTTTGLTSSSKDLICDLRHMIDQARRHVAAIVNMNLTMLTGESENELKRKFYKTIEQNMGRKLS